MLIKDYLKKNEISIYEFTRKVGIDPGNFRAYLHGRRGMSPRVAVMIEQATLGIVSRCECIWPEDYQDKKNGGTQMRMLAKMK